MPTRSPSMKLAQKRYYDKNKLKVNKISRDRLKDAYDDEAKLKKKLYYLKNRNYQDKTFHIDLIRLFKEI
mgnify:CR=1 FL=1|tara:strand:+ start:168 stop:377 length:210 start_codon:yes stop_codon:yes gene_type:complete